MSSPLWRTKSIDALLASAEHPEKKLAKTLGLWSLVGLGVGAVIGSVSAAAIVRGANRRGATAGGTAFLLIGAAIVVGFLALIPVVGYLEALLMPVIAARRARHGPDKYAGLRSLAK